MNSSNKDYNKLYQLQDKFLTWWLSLGLPFYLTGGTALGRYYLNHRFSDDLDFFTNANAQYTSSIAELNRKIKGQFEVNLQQSLFADDFTRFFITEDDIFLKIELINDIAYYAGKPEAYKFGLIDTPLNILSNKLTALVGRDEPKNIFDIIHLSTSYSFNWMDIFYHAKQKATINELDVEQRLASFPVEWLENVNWLTTPINAEKYRIILNTIADDFLLGKANSLGKNQLPIENAKPIL
jgi:predicted nucleotidyltransferase component of viral defense system